MSVELDKDLLVDLGGWSVLKEAQGLQESGCVRETDWDKKVLRGTVQVGDKNYFPRLNFRSTIFAENRCNCLPGQSGQICAHAIALCLEEMAPKPGPTPKTEGDNSEPPRVIQSLVLSDNKGIPLRFRVFLPPNLERTAATDRITIKVAIEEAGGKIYPPERIDRGRAYHLNLPHLAVAAHIESWCDGNLYGLLQLTRERLVTLLKALKNEPVIYWANNSDDPVAWQNGVLPGVHAFLELPEPIEANPESEATTRPSTISLREKSQQKSLQSSESASQPVTVDGSPNFLAIQLPPKSAVDYERLLSLVKDYPFKLEPANRRWWLRDRHKTLNFLAEHYEDLRDKHRADFSPNFKKQFRNMELAQVHTEVAQAGDQFEVTLALGDGKDTSTIQQELTRGRMYWESGDKLFIAPKKRIQAFSRLQQRLENNPAKVLTSKTKVRLNAWQLADTETLVDEVVHNFETPSAWFEKSKALTNLSALQEAPVGEALKNTLRLYQKIGTAWLYHLHRYDLAGILADEMGLGKTLQTLAYIESLLKDLSGTVLVVCPAGLLTNWQREAQQFTPGLVSNHNCKFIAGNPVDVPCQG